MMSQLKYFAYPGFGERTVREANSSQAVRVGNTIKISGQGGWDRKTEEFPDSLGKEVDQAFDNVQHTLEQAGGKGWDQVYLLRVYFGPWNDEAAGHVVRNLKKWCPNHAPIMTVIGVQKLFRDMAIEIEVEAYLG